MADDTKFAATPQDDGIDFRPASSRSNFKAASDGIDFQPSAPSMRAPSASVDDGLDFQPASKPTTFGDVYGPPQASRSTLTQRASRIGAPSADVSSFAPKSFDLTTVPRSPFTNAYAPAPPIATEEEKQRQGTLSARPRGGVAHGTPYEGAADIGERVTRAFGAGAPEGSIMANLTGQQGTKDNPRLFAPEQLMTESEQQRHPILTGAGEFAGGFTSPEGLTLLGLTAGAGELAGPGAQTVKRLMAAGFSGSMLYSAAQKVPAISEAIRTGDSYNAQRLLTQAVLEAGTAGLAGRGAFEEAAPSTVPKGTISAPLAVDSATARGARRFQGFDANAAARAGMGNLANAEQGIEAARQARINAPVNVPPTQGEPLLLTGRAYGPPRNPLEEEAAQVREQRAAGQKPAFGVVDKRRFTPGEPQAETTAPYFEIAPQSQPQPRGLIAAPSAADTIAGRGRSARVSDLASRSLDDVENSLVQRFGPDVLDEARQELNAAGGLASSFERPGRYFSSIGQTEEMIPQRSQSSAKGIHAGGTWYGVGSARDMIQDMHPWFADVAEGPETLSRTVQEGQGAAYDRLLERAATHLQNERESARPIVEEYAPRLQSLALQVHDVDPELAHTLNELAQGGAVGFKNLREYIEGKIHDAQTAATFSRAIEDAASEARGEAGAEEPFESGGEARAAENRGEQATGEHAGSVGHDGIDFESSESQPINPAESGRQERRQDIAQRRRVAEMTPEEMKRELLSSPVTGLPNRRAFDEAGASPAVAMSDADGLKAVNDRFGYEAGSELLRAKADALREAGLGAYHDKGDEFLYRDRNPEQLQTKLERARNILRDKVIEATMADGSVRRFKGADFSYGHGKDLAEAEAELKANKSEREARGERARGELRGIAELGPEKGEVHQGREEKAVEPAPAELSSGPNPKALIQGARMLSRVWDERVARPLIDKVLKIGDKYQKAREADPAVAEGLHLLDNAPQYLRAKAAQEVHNVIGDLSRAQERLFTLMADADSRENLRLNHPQEYRQAQNDPAVQAALKKYKPLEQELTALREKMGGENLDQDYLRRVYEKHVAGVNKPTAEGAPAESGQFDRVIRPQDVNPKSREASAEYHYKNGLHEFGPAFATKFIATHLKGLRDEVAQEFLSKATLVQNGSDAPRSITYGGERYFRPDAVREMHDAGGKGAKEYGYYDPTSGEKFPAPAEGRYLGPKEITKALSDYGHKEQGEPGALRRFFQEQILGFGFGVPHVFNILRRVTQQTPGGAANPKAWVEALKVGLSKELRERGLSGLNDPTFDMLAKHGAISTGEVSHLKEYIGGNLNPANWMRGFAQVGHKALFEPGSFGGFGGLDQRARLYVADLMRSQRPELSYTQISKAVNDALGEYSRANWTDRQKLLGRFMMFPGWDFSSLRWVLQHPIRTTVPPAVVVMLANRALHSFGQNREEDQNDISAIHVGDRAFSTSLLRESMARNLFRPALNYAQAKVRGASNQRALDEAARGITSGAGGLLSMMRPDLSGFVALATNRENLFSGKEIVSKQDYNSPGKVLPSKALEKQAVFTVRHALPALDRMLDSNQDVDLRSFVGGNLGFPNYRDDAEKRLIRNSAEAERVYQQVGKLAKTDPAKAREYLKDPDNAAYALFYRDLAGMTQMLHRIDQTKESVENGKLSDAEKQSRLQAIEKARTNLLSHADGMNKLLFERRQKMATQFGEGALSPMLPVAQSPYSPPARTQ